jgi:hypothetical protein
VEDTYAVIVVNGKDGVGLGYSYLTLPRAGPLAEVPPEARFDEILGNAPTTPRT